MMFLEAVYLVNFVRDPTFTIFCPFVSVGFFTAQQKMLKKVRFMFFSQNFSQLPKKIFARLYLKDHLIYQFVLFP